MHVYALTGLTLRYYSMGLTICLPCNAMNTSVTPASWTILHTECYGLVYSHKSILTNK